MRETWVQFLGWEDPLEKGKATHSSILAWRIDGMYSAWDNKELDTTEWLSLSTIVLMEVVLVLSLTHTFISVIFVKWKNNKKAQMSNIKKWINCGASKPLKKWSLKKFFFSMWIIFKVFTEFVTIMFLLYVLVIWLLGMWDLISPIIRDWTHTPCIWGEALTNGLPGKSHEDLFLIQIFYNGKVNVIVLVNKQNKIISIHNFKIGKICPKLLPMFMSK